MSLHQTYTNLIFKVFNICKDEFARAETFSTNFHFTNLVVWTVSLVR